MKQIIITIMFALITLEGLAQERFVVVNRTKHSPENFQRSRVTFMLQT